jgi:hypothetical protein
VEAIEYPPSHVEDYDKDLPPAVWTKYLKDSDRPTYRLAEFDWMPAWMPSIAEWCMRYSYRGTRTVAFCKERLYYLVKDFKTVCDACVAVAAYSTSLEL